MKRREFLQKGCLSAAGIASLRLSEPGFPQSNPDQAEKTKETMKYRTLGKTGLKVTLMGFGAMITPDAQLLYRAIRDYGINYVDTARGYQGGQNEDLVARGIGDKRKEIILATKFGPRSDKSRIIQSVETSLNHLKTDYIDIIHLHGGSSKEDIMSPDVLEAMTQLKKDGKVRFFGTSTHGNETAVVNAVAESNFYDIVLVKYNFMSSPELIEAVAKARAKGIGIVAMKIMNKSGKTTERLNPFQAALRWVTDNPNVDTTIPSITSFSQLEDNYKAVIANSTWGDRKTLYLYGKSLEGEYCKWCGDCENTCLMGLRISELNRALMYAEGYGEYELAQSTYSSIPLSANISQCEDCKSCTVTCPYGVNVRGKIERAKEEFGSLRV